jgi:signal transduction histidine kinase
MNVESLLKESHNRPALQEKIEKIQKIAGKLDSDISYLAWMLRPAILDDLGLVPALDCFVAEWSERFGIKAEFKAVNVDDEGLDPDLETNLYRITQEALTNTAKHASATSANVILEQKPGVLKLIIEDNGKGFSQADGGRATDMHGLGLGGMRDRARLVGASFEIESSEDAGTSIFITVPVVP